MRGSFRSNGILLIEGRPPSGRRKPALRGLKPCAKPGQGLKGAAAVLDMVRPWLKGALAIASRMPCAAEVGKYQPYPPRRTVLSLMRQAAPKRGAILVQSVFTRPRPRPILSAVV